MEYFRTLRFQDIKKSSSPGFTLVEMLVVVLIIGIIFTTAFALFNPSAQISKSQNAQRQHDLEQIKTALDTYFNDTGCYPSDVTFGSEWKGSGNGIYLTTVPEDPLCKSSGDNCYVYQTDPTVSCPQWNVLYAKLAAPVSQNVTCPLESLNTCVPLNYTNLGMNYCVISGTVNCSYVSTNSITPVPPGGIVPTPTGTNQTPSGTPTPIFCQPGNYHACTGSGANGCNTISPDSQCSVLGGSLQCYCTTDCSVNGVVQCH